MNTESLGLGALSRLLHGLWMQPFVNWVFNHSDLTVLPCFPDGFLTSVSRRGTLAGIRKRWDFKVNFAEVT